MGTGITTPLRPGTYKKLILNAGAIVVGFDPSSYTTPEALKTALASFLSDPEKTLGATRGGGSFTFTREMRQVEADGTRYRFKGDTMVDSADGYLSTTLLELGNAAGLKRAIGTGELTSSSQKHLLKIRTRIQNSDYLANMCWVGDIADGGFVVIWLKNAFNTADLAITYTDKGEATLPVEFHAYQDSVDDYDYAPVDIIYLDASTYTAVQNPSGNPHTLGYYEMNGAGRYVLTDDTSVVEGKTYYTASA